MPGQLFPLSATSPLVRAPAGGQYNNYHRAGSSVGEDNAGLFRMTLGNRGGSEAPGSEERAAGCDYEELLDYRFRVSNCCCFSADGKVMYFADTPTRKVYAFDYDPKGKPANRRLVWSMPPHLPGGPDGAQVDAEGMLWVALNGAGCVVRIDPLAQPAAGGGGEGGRVNTVVNLPVACPTSVTFGGAELDELFITTRGPDGGGLLRFKVPFGVKGLPEPEFIGCEKFQPCAVRARFRARPSMRLRGCAVCGCRGGLFGS